MTEQEQRIWDHVYAAEFVRLVGYGPAESALHAAMRADDAITPLRKLHRKPP